MRGGQMSQPPQQPLPPLPPEILGSLMNLSTGLLNKLGPTMNQLQAQNVVGKVMTTLQSPNVVGRLQSPNVVGPLMSLGGALMGILQSALAAPVSPGGEPLQTMLMKSIPLQLILTDPIIKNALTTLSKV